MLLVTPGYNRHHSQQGAKNFFLKLSTTKLPLAALVKKVYGTQEYGLRPQNIITIPTTDPSNFDLHTTLE